MFLNLDLNHLEHYLIIPIDSKIYIQTSLCSRFANCFKHIEPNKLPIWQFVTKLSYKIKCSNTRTTQYNKMPNYITNPNLRLLTQKLQEEVEGLDQNAPVFPKTLNKHITACVERKTYKKQAKSTFSSLHFHTIPTLVPIFYFYCFQSLFRKTSSVLVLSVSAVRALIERTKIDDIFQNKD